MNEGRIGRTKGTGRIERTRRTGECLLCGKELNDLSFVACNRGTIGANEVRLSIPASLTIVL